jgi:hypothetical protein
VENFYHVQHIFTCKSFFPTDDDFLRIIVPIINDEEQRRNAEELEENEDEVPDEDDDLDDNFDEEGEMEDEDGDRDEDN